MKVDLFCPNCGLRVNDISGEHALEHINKYDTIVLGRPHSIRCFCGHDFHIIGSETKESYTFKNDINRLAEI